MTFSAAILTGISTDIARTKRDAEQTRCSSEQISSKCLAQIQSDSLQLMRLWLKGY